MIITPQQIEDERRKAEVEHLHWKAIYDSDKEVRELSDEIHSKRMMAPPACDDCIRIAVAKLRTTKPEGNTTEDVGDEEEDDDE